MSNDIIVEVSDSQPIIVEVGSISAGLPAGTTDGDILIWNATSGSWESISELGKVMYKDVYDIDLDDIVDEAEKIDGGTF